MFPTEKAFGLNNYHAVLVADGSGSMSDKEKKGNKKHIAVAQMIQKLIDNLHDDPELFNLVLTVICYDSSNYKDVRLDTYDCKSETYYKNTDLSLWDPLESHGYQTNIGETLEFTRLRAEGWVNHALGMEQRRCVIYTMSDGMNNNGPDGSEQKAKIESFNTSTDKGRIRLATIGYFQDADNNEKEAEGRRLLKSLVTNDRAYFETDNASQITQYIKSTITSLG